MSISIAPVASPATCPPSRVLPVVWARVLGSAPFSPDLVHHLAANAAGEVLVSAQLERANGGTVSGGAELEDDREDEDTRDLSTARLVKLAPDGQRAWTLPLRAARLLRPPSVALDDQGCAYVAGPYFPGDNGLRLAREMTLTKLRADGTAEWSRVLGDFPDHGEPLGEPGPYVAAAPGGGACVTWVGRGRRWLAALRAAFVSEDNSIQWEHAWPIAGEVRCPQVSLDAGGDAVIWGAFRGALFFSPSVRVENVGQARYLARVRGDGHMCWAQAFPAEHDDAHALAVGRDGKIAVAALVRSQGGEEVGTRSELHLIQAHATGAPANQIRGACEPHTAITSLRVAPLDREVFAVAGYVSGAFRIGGATVRSLTPAQEALFVVHVAGKGQVAARVFQGPQLQGGLSVAGTVDGSILVGGWLCGTMMLGDHKLVSPRDGASLFLAKLATH